MLEDYLKSKSTCRRLRESKAGLHAEVFVLSRVAEGYSPATVEQTCNFLATFLTWIERAGFAEDLAAGVAAYGEFAPKGKLRKSRDTIRRERRAGNQYLRFLQLQGVVPVPKTPREIWPILASFHAWEVEHRGLAETTLRLYEEVLADLLERLGDNPKAYTARLLRDFVFEKARPHSRRRGETIICAVRAFLRFLIAVGKCRDGLAEAMPGFASWKLSSLPRHLEPEVVRQVIDACPAKTPVLRRDRAILLLLARLGLRAGDIGRITFSDIDWRNATIAVAGKSRRQERLPLPQDVGDAILGYIRHGRPLIRHPNVFLTARAPHRPVSSGTVTWIACTAIRRAGVESPSHGAHVFRHSAATAMLRQGASLASIAAVLRHRSPDTTLQYAKVDFASLREVAMPWPEVSPC